MASASAITILAAFTLLLALVQSVQAEVLHAGDSSFGVSHTVSVSASPAESWAALARISDWWNGDHSWSGDAGNLYLRAEPGGCFCERLPGEDGSMGGVEHLRVIYIKPGAEIRFDGSLGPLMDMPVQGRMAWKISAAEDNTGGSTIRFTYLVHGYMDGGFTGLAPVVDSVIGEQIQGLARLLQGPD